MTVCPCSAMRANTWFSHWMSSAARASQLPQLVETTCELSSLAILL